ncbi:hypothetical protein ATE84_0273 [Aquimarina sp. MAR_2010_214]|uniref:hypothetical protein n=1 Tax=Aquimarina sp. MAR_2010_214 TaxID=1250026 RepID=UPI000C6FE8E0|nr:hypothetical protein [Aquimarina sp. MAR_2010_214]PKV48277.1 hypothetical protein ATE84_0273 [Aquimarina sp. MAR_2010_214]
MMTATNNSPEKEIKEIHFDILKWKSSLRFIEGEIHFINQLLNSYIFEPTTPNLFERIQEFKQQIVAIEEKTKNINDEIRKHESELGGMLECDTISCDNFYYKNHTLVKGEFDDFYRNFNTLKSEVFLYAGGVLRKNKKQS